MHRLALMHLTVIGALLCGGGAWEAAAPAPAQAEAIDIDSLPGNKKQYRSTVQKFLKKVDGMIAKLKQNAGSLDLPEGKRSDRVILELISLRDITERELAKFDFTEHGRFTEDEVRNSVNQALTLLGERYEAAEGYLG